MNPLLNYSERQVVTVCTRIFFKHQSKTSDRDLGKRKGEGASTTVLDIGTQVRNSDALWVA